MYPRWSFRLTSSMGNGLMTISIWKVMKLCCCMSSCVWRIMCQLHAVTQGVQIDFYFYFRVTMNNWQWLEVPESLTNLSYIAYTRRVIYTYLDDRWAVATRINWSTIHFKQTRIENDYRKRYDMSNQHHDPVPKLEWSRKWSLPQVSHCNICKNVAFRQPSFL